MWERLARLWESQGLSKRVFIPCALERFVLLSMSRTKRAWSDYSQAASEHFKELEHLLSSN